MQGYGTIVTAVCAALAAVLGWLAGEVPGDQMIMAVWGVSLVVCARIGLDLNVGGWLAGYKTYIDAILGMVGAVGGWAGGKLTVEQMITAIVMGLLAIFYRRGVKKAIPGAPGN